MYKRVGYVLKRAQAALRASMDEELAANGLNTARFAALFALKREPGLSNADLARRAFVTPQTMIRIVEGLESRGLIVRTPHPTHGRVLETSLSPSGKKLVAACSQDVIDVEARMLRLLSAREQSQLFELLNRCVAGLE
jgi:DNA-binding MarR family transcriptional regulator